MRTAARTLIIALLLLSGSSAHATGPAAESDLKAAYLVNVLKLVHRKDLPAGQDSLMVCVAAAGTVEPSLRALEGRLIGGRKLKLRSLQKDDDLQSCAAIFLGRTAGYLPLLKRANRLGLLTIGSDAEFIAAAGMVSLVVEGRKIVVEVNGDAIKDANWVFSSHLLEVSRVTRPGSTE